MGRREDKRPSLPRAARWGLLIVTALMGVALVGSGAAGVVNAEATSVAVARSSGIMLVRAIRRELRSSDADLNKVLRGVEEELAAEGLRFVGLRDPQGVWVAISAPMEDDWSPLMKQFPDEMPMTATSDGVYRLVVPWYRPARSPAPADDAARAAVRPAAGAAQSRMGQLALEFLPSEAAALESHAWITLGVSIAAALLLFLAAVRFWRQSVLAEQVEAQLAQDRQLKALGQMSAVLGHELRNPLASLKGHAQLLLEKIPAEHLARRGVDTVVREATRLELLTNQVLDFAKTGALAIAPADPAEVVRSAVARCEAAPVEVCSGAAVARWPLDRARLEQVLVNLLNNARQASPAGAPVEVRLGMEGGELVLEVRDHGDGIRAGDEERIFEPFFTTRTKGTGLGLSLARRIVEGHGGRLEASNHPGGGAVFRAALPGERA